MTTLRAIILGLILAAGCARHGVGTEADAPLATWAGGEGRIAGRASAAAAPIAGGELVAAEADTIAITLTGIPGSQVILAPGSALSLGSEATATGRLLIIALERGTVQVDIPPDVVHGGVMLRGAALEVRVTGTLFVVERTPQQSDFVSLVRGRLLVNLRRELAEALASRTGVELKPRQGVGGDRGTGMGQVQQLANIPLLSIALAGSTSEDQRMVGNARTGAADESAPTVDGIANDDLGLIVEDVVDQLASEVFTTVGTAVVDEIITSVAEEAMLGDPPAPP